MSKSKFFNKMVDATIERQVEDVYNEGISFYFNEEDGSPLKIKYPYSCDTDLHRLRALRYSAQDCSAPCCGTKNGNTDPKVRWDRR